MALFIGNATTDNINGSSAEAIFEHILGADSLNGLAGSDEFKFTQTPVNGAKIDGGTGDGISDATVDIPSGENAKGNTLSTIVTYQQTDSLTIQNSMELFALDFTHIEKITLQEGVELTMSSAQS